MKKFFITGLLAIFLVGGQAWAAGDEISPEARKAFNAEFPDAQFSKWERLREADLYLVRFLYNGEGRVAYLNPDGDIVASVRFVKKEHLPHIVSKSIMKKFDLGEVRQVEELTLGDGLSYFVTVLHEEYYIVMRVYTDGTAEMRSKKRMVKGF